MLLSWSGAVESAACRMICRLLALVFPLLLVECSRIARCLPIPGLLLARIIFPLLDATRGLKQYRWLLAASFCCLLD